MFFIILLFVFVYNMPPKKAFKSAKKSYVSPYFGRHEKWDDRGFRKQTQNAIAHGSIADYAHYRAAGESRVLSTPNHAAYLLKHEGVYYLYNTNDSEGWGPDGAPDELRNVTNVIRPLTKRQHAFQALPESHPDAKKLSDFIGLGRCAGISSKIGRFINKLLVEHGLNIETVNRELCAVPTIDFLMLNVP